MKSPATIFITGASSGIGAALAKLYARDGVRLFLAGRDRARLNAIAAQCREMGATVECLVCDVTDQQVMTETISRIGEVDKLDLVIANAGIGLPGGTLATLRSETEDTFAVNVGGVMNTIFPALAIMEGQGSGQIAIMSSIAGYRGLPSAIAYSASKNAVRAFGEALRGSSAASNIDVSVIMPGFVTSPMTAKNRFPMPFLMPAEKAARIIKKGLERNKARIAFPWQLVLFIRLVSMLPEAMLDPLLRRLPRK